MKLKRDHVVISAKDKFLLELIVNTHTLLYHLFAGATFMTVLFVVVVSASILNSEITPTPSTPTPYSEYIVLLLGSIG
jgi:hypothetical protein